MRRVLLLRRLRAADGHTLVELIAVMAILLIVLTTLTGLFVSGSRAELDLNRRFEAQQSARVAVDRMRREVHCSSGITLTSASSITVALKAHCPTSGGSDTTVVYTTELVSASRYRLKRGTTTIADHLTSGDVFSYVPQSDASRALLHLDLPVNAAPNEGWKTWRLETDIVLRNTTRETPDP